MNMLSHGSAHPCSMRFGETAHRLYGEIDMDLHISPWLLVKLFVDSKIQ